MSPAEEQFERLAKAMMARWDSAARKLHEQATAAGKQILDLHTAETIAQRLQADPDLKAKVLALVAEPAPGEKSGTPR